MGGDVLEQLGVEGVDDEVAVEEDEHRVLPCLARRGDEQRLRRRRSRAGRGRRRRAATAPRRRLDPDEADAVAPVVEHASRLRPHAPAVEQKAVCEEHERCRRDVHVNREPPSEWSCQ